MCVVLFALKPIIQTQLFTDNSCVCLF